MNSGYMGMAERGEHGVGERRVVKEGEMGS